MKAKKKYFKQLNNLRDLVYQDAKDKGWHSAEEQPANVAAYCANLHGEVSELWESWRKNQLYSLCDKATEMQEHGLFGLTCAEEELADIIIRALDSSAALNIDISRAIEVKLLYNRTRPHRNGGKKA